MIDLEYNFSGLGTQKFFGEAYVIFFIAFMFISISGKLVAIKHASAYGLNSYKPFIFLAFCTATLRRATSTEIQFVFCSHFLLLTFVDVTNSRFEHFTSLEKLNRFVQEKDFAFRRESLQSC